MSTSGPARRPRLLNTLRLQGVILTLVVGFAVRFDLAVLISQNHVPIPDRRGAGSARPSRSIEVIRLDQRSSGA